MRYGSIVLFGFTHLTANACATGSYNSDSASEIGSTLNSKVDIAISDVPPEVLATARKERPDLIFTEAEREIRNGVIYFDVEGVNSTGEEIELDIMQEGSGWRVVEVQRDIDYADAPEAVRKALEQKVPTASPDRVIESDQRDGVIIYEFFDRSPDGAEAKYEVKLDRDGAVFPESEWVH